MNRTIQLCGDIWQKLVKQYPDHKLAALRKMLQKQLQKHYHITLCDATIINYLSQYRNCNTKLPQTWNVDITNSYKDWVVTTYPNVILISVY